MKSVSAPQCCGTAMIKEKGTIAVPHLPSFGDRRAPVVIWRERLGWFWVCYRCGETEEGS